MSSDAATHVGRDPHRIRADSVQMKTIIYAKARHQLGPRSFAFTTSSSSSYRLDLGSRYRTTRRVA